MGRLQEFADYMEVHYENVNTQAKYIEVAGRLGADSFNQEGVNRFFAKRKNNTLNRAVVKAVAECFELDIKIPGQKSRKDTSEKRKFLTKEEVDFIIQNTTPKISIMVQLMFETGARLSEIVNLKRDHIDLEHRRITGIGKGLKHFNLTFSSKTSLTLTNYLNSNFEEFPFHYKGVTHQTRKFWYELKRECEKKGMEGVHPHRIRHSLGHYLRADLGFDLEQVRERLRHKSIVTTQIYSTATKEEVEQKIERELFED